MHLGAVLDENNINIVHFHVATNSTTSCFSGLSLAATLPSHGRGHEQANAIGAVAPGGAWAQSRCLCQGTHACEGHAREHTEWAFKF